MKPYQEATIFFQQVRLVNLWRMGFRNEIVQPKLSLNCSPGPVFGLVEACSSSLMNETKTFNLVKCEWLSISLD